MLKTVLCIYHGNMWVVVTCCCGQYVMPASAFVMGITEFDGIGTITNKLQNIN
jgi:hypothetical protein